MLRPLLALAVTGVVLTGAHALAHHSAAMFDFRNTKTLEGTVKMVEVINPHTHMLVTITDERGTRDWNFEGHSASNFYRAGYNRGSVQAGDPITITIAPMRDGSDGGYIVSFITKDGDQVMMGQR
jgi:hypothetical protein